MDFDNYVKENINQLENAIKELRAAIKKIEDARNLTQRFLSNCAAVGIKKVAIGKAHKSIPESIRFCFGPEGSAFSNDVEFNGWPAIWEAAKRTDGIKPRCGNSNQYAVGDDMIDGVYQLRAGKWKKLR
jgi:hypothetical protein